MKYSKFFPLISFLLLTVSTVNAQDLSLKLRAESNRANSQLENNYGFNGLSTGRINPLYRINHVSGNNNTLGGSASFFHPQLFGNYFGNIKDAFSGNNLYLHAAGIASTFLIVSSGLDYKVEHFFNQHPDYGAAARPVVISGSLLPIIAGGSLFLAAKLKNDNELLGASYAVLQSSLTTLLYISALKAITGRPHPDWRHSDNMEKLSKTFRFGFLRGGVFWGWPSGHTAATMSVVSALINYYPNSAWLKVAGYSLVAYTIFGVSSVNRGGMHWFSDAVAAAFMSYAIGSTIGKYYRKAFSTAASAEGVSGSAGISPSYNGYNFSIGISF